MRVPCLPSASPPLQLTLFLPLLSSLSSLPQLINPHNLCYAVSALQMLFARRSDPKVEDWANLSGLMQELTIAMTSPISVASLRSLLYCHPDERLANRQCDAYEYIMTLLADHQGSLQATPWRRNLRSLSLRPDGDFRTLSLLH